MASRRQQGKTEPGAAGEMQGKAADMHRILQKFSGRRQSFQINAYFCERQPAGLTVTLFTCWRLSRQTLRNVSFVRVAVHWGLKEGEAAGFQNEIQFTIGYYEKKESFIISLIHSILIKQQVLFKSHIAFG